MIFHPVTFLLHLNLQVVQLPVHIFLARCPNLVQLLLLVVSLPHPDGALLYRLLRLRRRLVHQLLPRALASLQALKARAKRGGNEYSITMEVSLQSSIFCISVCALLTQLSVRLGMLYSYEAILDAPSS